MNRSVFSAVAAALALLAGCGEGSLDPKYPRALIAFDEGLLGRWIVEDQGDAQNPPPTVEFARRDVPVEGGILHPERDAPRAQAGGPGPDVAGAYTITLEPGGDHEPVRLHGYLVESGGRRFLGLQATFSQLAKGAGHPLAIPTHVLCKFERDGDAARIWMPETWVAWAPDLVMLDAPEGPPPPIDLDRLEGKVGVTLSIERLVEFCAGHADDPRLYKEAVTLRRAPAPAAPDAEADE